MTSVAEAAGTAAAPEPDGYLVAPFENESQVKALDWMASALAVTLAEKMESLPQLRPVYRGGVLDGWPAEFDQPRALAMAKDTGAKWVVAGSFSRPNWKAGVKVRLLEVTDAGLREVATQSMVGERDDLMKLLDDAMTAVLTTQGWIPSGDALAALHRRPTKDLYAMTLYGRALNFYFGLGVEQSDEQAQKLLTRTTFIDPKFAEAHRVLGLVDLAAGQSSKAAGQYAYALDLKPGYYAAIAGLARLYHDDNKRQPAREMATAALVLRPYDADVRLLLGTIELEAGEYDKALVNLQKVVAARPRNVVARRQLAQVYSARGDIQELADELGRVVDLAPEDVDARLDLGSAYMRLGRSEKAIGAYDDVIKRQPRNVQALKFTGDLYRRVGDPKRAADAYERVRRLSPDDPRPYFLLGATYAEAGNDAKAMAVLEEAVNFKNYVGEAWTDLGALYLRHGDLTKAGVYLSKAVARSPMRPKAHFNLALLLDATKQRDRALQELHTASELDPEDPECHYLEGVIQLRLGHFDDARLAFAEALRLKPDHADAKHNMALLEDLDRRYGGERAGVGAQ